MTILWSATPFAIAYVGLLWAIIWAKLPTVVMGAVDIKSWWNGVLQNNEKWKSCLIMVRKKWLGKHKIYFQVPIKLQCLISVSLKLPDFSH